MIRHLLLPAVAGLMLLASGAFAAQPVPTGRLPDDVQPQRYRLQLDIDPRQAKFSGTTDIDIDVKRPVRTIWLHGHGLDVRKVTVESGGQSLKARYKEAEPLHGVARIDLPRQLPAGRATLHFEYTAPFRDSPDGLYRTKSGDDWYAFTQFESIDARRAFPCFDEPRFKTPFEVTVTAPASDKVVTNGPDADATVIADGRMRHRFEPTLPLPTYLVAFAVGPLDIVGIEVPPNSVRSRELALRAVATRGREPQLAYAIKHTPEIIAALEQYFAIPYPYPKLDIIASPVHLGAMENAGAIIFDDTYVLLDEPARPSQERNFYEVVAHEIAHHWFGDLVTPAWWDDIWLNESFAEWMGVKIAAQLRPDLGSRAVESAGVVYAMDVDSKRAGRPIHEPVTDNSRIDSTFDAITYLKGGQVLAMVESYVGAEKFRSGIQDFLKRHEHGSATSDEFFAALAQASGQPAVIAAFRSFVDQPGVPLISIASGPGNDAELVVSQDRYLPIGSTLTGGQRWQVPLCMHAYPNAGAPSKTCSLLTDRSGSYPVATGTVALMPNADGAGYYRFALPGPRFDALLDVAPRLPESESIMVADSAAAAFLAGRLEFPRLLDAAARLSTSPNSVAATLLGDELAMIKDRWADAATRDAMAARIRSIYGPRLAGLGLDPRRGAYAAESADRRDLRRLLATLVIDEGRDADLRRSLAETARASLDDPSAIDPEFRPLVWSVGVQDLGESFGQALEARMLASDDGLLRADAAWALGHAEDSQGSRRALALVLRPDVRPGEVSRILYPQFASPLTRDSTWTWFKSNTDRVLDKVASIFQARYIELLDSYCDSAHRNDIAQSLKAQVRKMGSGELEMQRTLEGIDLCIAQRAALGPSVEAALRTQ